jgi:ADP-ribosylglycohydrolase
LGLAIGDALGFPVEGLSRKRARRRYAGIDRYRFLGKTGFVSDDTEQAIMTAEAILEGQGDPVKAAKIFGSKLRGWFWTIPPGVGLSTAKACLKLTVGLPSGVASAGNGAAMRMAPVGLFSEDPEELAAALARVSHTDPRGVEGAVAVAFGVSRLIRGQSCDLSDLPSFQSELGPALRRAWDLVQAGTDFDTISDEIGTTGYVLHTVPLSFAALWSHPETFLVGLQTVILQGGDADSNGAVAGALLGAHFGVGGIPEELVDRLEPSHGCERILRLTEQLLEGKGEVVRPSFLALRWREAQIKFAVGLHVLGRLIP